MKHRMQRLLFTGVFYAVWFVTVYLLDRFRKPQAADDWGNVWLIFLGFMLVAVFHFIICLFKLIRGDKDYILAALLHVVMLIIVIYLFFI